MIVFDLKCRNDHQFQGWFKNGDAFDAQSAAGEVSCPLCGDTKVEKAPMAPRLVKSRGDAVERRAQVMAEVKRALGELRSQVEEKCDYVGDKFPEEARKIHYGETEARGIYGEATKEEADALEDEGIEVASIPWLPRTDS